MDMTRVDLRPTIQYHAILPVVGSAFTNVTASPQRDCTSPLKENPHLKTRDVTC